MYYYHDIERLMPNFILNGSINVNPDITFRLFFNLQLPSDNGTIVFNQHKDDVRKFGHTKYGNLSTNEISDELNQMLTVKNSELVAIKFWPYRLRREWIEYFGNVSALDRITQYIPQQSAILNMYKHQEHCLEQIEDYQRNKSIVEEISYAISTREDVYYFKPINITSLFHSFGNCDLLAKECLSWGGINMRFQIMRSGQNNIDIIRRVIGSRFKFYRHLYSKSKRRLPFNPEMFEAAQIGHYKVKDCTLNVAYFPITAARPLNSQGEICFTRNDLFGAIRNNRYCDDKCFTPDLESFVTNRICENLMRTPPKSIR